jgi:branched-subunit amino acid ABC-type transport system permease component
MTLSSFLIQLLNGLAGASSLFLVGAGLSLIFGITRVVNFAHGSLYMLGLYIAYSLTEWLNAQFGASAPGFWGGVLLAAAAVAAIGVLVEILLLRRIYRAPELFQLLATFALVLVIKDAALYVWGACARLVRLGRTARTSLPAIQPAADVDWPAGTGRALAAAQQDPLGCPDQGRDPGPRHGRSPWRESGLALHQRLRTGRLSGRPRRRPATAAGAGQPEP